MFIAVLLIHCEKMKNFFQKGFTLIELMIVIAIMGIMTAMAVPSYQAFMAQRRLNGAARQVMSDLMAARMQAITQNNEFRNRFRRAFGFTLLELMIVMAIIGIIAVIAIPQMNAYLNRAKMARARGDIDKIFKAMVLLEADTGLWPGFQGVDEINQGSGNEVWNLGTSSAGLVANGGYPNWHGPYMSSVPLDPWGNRYFLDTDYQVNGEWHVVIGSFGPNGCCQNVYDDDNVIKVLW